MTSWNVEAVRSQFPALHKTINGRTPIFFDGPAGTQVPRRVIDAVSAYFENINANQGGMFPTSQATDEMVDATRQKLAAFLNASRADEIVIGPNTTSLNFALSRAIIKTFSPGDEIVVTRMDHDANVAPWLRAAQDFGLNVRWVEFHDQDITLDMDTLEAALNEKTRLVATVHASNAAGTINPVRQIAGMAHAAGALHVVDAVQSAPHVSLDVQAIGCDFLLCSVYKFYGPHAGILWGRYDLLAELPAYKVRPSEDTPPFRWETGTPAFELIAGIGATIDYLASLGEEGGTYREQLVSAYARFSRYETELVMHLLDVLETFPNIHIAGITDRSRLSERVPTVIFTHDSYASAQVAERLAGQGIYVWDGNYYAYELMRALNRPDGMVRIGLAHYNTHAEVDRLAEVLRTL
ncbi:MAG: cysteine desulfurase-like protein [Anaerolineae bacterium]|nr:cysteine desulfurase-like protein [Anaerolineae bacterium]